MAIEGIEPPAVVFIDSLVSANPVGTTSKVKELDNHIRGIKNVLLNQFPNLDAAVNGTPTELDRLVGLTSDIVELAGAQSITGVKTLASPVLNTPTLNTPQVNSPEFTYTARTTESIGAGAYWTPLVGLYTFVAPIASGIYLEVFNGSSWAQSNLGSAGAFVTDGANVRFYNSGGSPSTVTYLKW